jgi:hypothetical protein
MTLTALLVLSSIIDLSQITWAGNGCAGSGEPLSFYLNRRVERLYVSLPEMSADAGAKPLDRKSCSLAMPFALPPEKKLVLGHPALYGEAILGASAEGRVQGEVFLAGGQGPIASRVLTASDGRPRAAFYVRENQAIESECGASGVLRVNLSVLAKKSDPAENAKVTLEGSALSVQVRDCI